MKQRISAEDLKQLSLSQQEKLRAWWKPEEGDIYGGIGLYGQCVFNGNDKDIENYIDLFNDKIKPYSLPLLSIGQCIELLNENIDIINFMPGSYIIEHHPGKFESKELIDALFEAVKSIL